MKSEASPNCETHFREVRIEGRAETETICKWNEEGITIWPLVCNAPSQMRRLEWGHSLEEEEGKSPPKCVLLICYSVSPIHQHSRLCSIVDILCTSNSQA